MHSFGYFQQALLFGFVISAIIGPIGVLCIRKTLEFGFISGFAVGIGATLGDVIYAFIGGAGLTTISSFLIEQTAYIKVIGGLLLLYLGYTETKTKSDDTVTVGDAKQFFKIGMQSFVLTITSPMTILTFIALFASIAGENITMTQAVYMVTGIAIGALLWWLILVGIVAKIKNKISDLWMTRIRYTSATILIGFGVWCIFSGIQAI